MTMRFNPPPGWPTPPPGWLPPAGWNPDPSWPDPPERWQLYLPDDDDEPVDGPSDGDQSGDVETAGPDEAPPRTGKSAAPAAGGATTPPSSSVANEPAAVGAAPAGTAQLLARIAELEERLAAAGNDVVELNDQRVLQSVGIYRYHHPLETAAAYKERLARIDQQIGAFVSERRAVLAADMFTFDGSLARGRRMVKDLSRLMLRAYNAEADNCVRTLRSGNVSTARKRLESAMAAIENLGAVMEMRINPQYHAVRVMELELVADYQMKRQQEKEEAREERARLREQRKVEQELARERERLDKERAHYEHALAQLRINGDATAIGELEGRLADIDQAIADNDYRAANIRAGYVYVISNIGAFGPGIVKIGMTRRLDPMDRVRELGDASVPFRYDVHALHFSDDAVTLEGDLHRHFSDRRVNFVNMRREFFFASPTEVRDVLLEKAGGLLEYTEAPEAPEYFQSVGSWPEGIAPAAGEG